MSKILTPDACSQHFARPRRGRLACFCFCTNATCWLHLDAASYDLNFSAIRMLMFSAQGLVEYMLLFFVFVSEIPVQNLPMNWCIVYRGGEKSCCMNLYLQTCSKVKSKDE